jgi:hypothetical protein
VPPPDEVIPPVKTNTPPANSFYKYSWTTNGRAGQARVGGTNYSGLFNATTAWRIFFGNKPTNGFATNAYGPTLPSGAVLGGRPVGGPLGSNHLGAFHSPSNSISAYPGSVTNNTGH